MDQKTYVSNLLHILAGKHHKAIEELSKVLQIDYVHHDQLIHDYEEFDRYLDQDLRVVTGAYYTPRPLAEAMFRMTLRDYFVLNKGLSTDHGDRIFYDRERLAQGQELMEDLKKLHIADISCGSGMFLRVAYDVLEELYTRYGCFEGPETIIGRLHGFDVNKASLDVLKIWYSDKLLEQDCSLQDFNLYHGDTLLYKPGLKFDILIGNPPYVGEKGNKALFEKYKHLPGYEGRMDLFYFFIYQGMNWLKEDGILNLITTNYWITADGAKKLRTFIKQVGIHRLINLDECKLFEDAKGMHNLIFTLRKSQVGETHVKIIPEGQSFEEIRLWESDYKICQSRLFSESGNILIYDSKDYFTILDKVVAMSPMRLSAFAQVNQGIVSGGDSVTDSMMKKKFSAEELEENQIQKGEGIFVVDFDHDDCCKPFYKNSHIDAYQIQQSHDKYILYINDQTEISDTIKAHLSRFRPMLEKRREVEKGVRKWYALQWYRDQSIFEGEKIVVPQRSYMNRFAYHEGPFYASADVYYITHGPLKLLLGILNSKLIHFWLYTRGKRKGQYLELYAKPLSLIPIPLLEEKDQAEIIEKVAMILSKGYDDLLQSQIDHIIYKTYKLSEEEIDIIETLYKNRRKYA